MKYIQNKHSKLNEYSSQYGEGLLRLLAKEYETLTKDIKRKEKSLARVRKWFVFVFVFGMLIGGIAALVFQFLHVVNGGATTSLLSSAAGATAELAVFQAVTHPMRDSIKELDNRRANISNEWINASKNISVALAKEQEKLTDKLIGKTDML